MSTQLEKGAVFAQKVAYGNRDAAVAAVEEIFERFACVSALSPQSRVLIKPNLLAKHAPEKAVTTSPDLLYAVIVALQKRGVKNITVADSPGGPYSPAGMRAVYKTCGLAAVCEETGAAAYTACQSEKRPASGALVNEFELLSPVLESDFIINLPKLKTHVLTAMSGAVKNLFGCVPGLAKAEFHMRFPEREHFADMLVDLCEEVKADLHIVDGLLAMEGDGPGSGTPRRCDLLLAGQNPYTVDLAICQYMGMPPMETPVLAAAHRRGLCAAALAEGQLVGSDEATAPIPGFVPPRSYTGRVDFSGNVPGFLRPLVSVVGRAVAPRPKVRKAACIGCGKCAEICPQSVITLPGGRAKIDYKGCIRCFCCHEICPVHAIDVRKNPLFHL